MYKACYVPLPGASAGSVHSMHGDDGSVLLLSVDRSSLFFFISS